MPATGCTTPNRSRHLDRVRRCAFTMIELLVVITVLIVLTAIVIPVLRIITSDRQIREAGRVVESVFATARDDAIVNGFAGVDITPQGLYRLRARPPYAGDGQGDTATVSGARPNFTVNLPAMIVGYAATVNDTIRFNYRGPQYRIVAVNSATQFTILVEPYQPDPPTSAVPFQIYRQPVRVASSLVALPQRHYIDWEFSGDPLKTLIRKAPAPPGVPPDLNLSKFTSGGEYLRVVFTGLGGIDFVQDNLGATYRPTGPLYLLVIEDSDKFDETSGRSNLENLANVWVTVNNTDGSVFISAMGSLISTPPSPLFDARAPARQRFMALQ